MYFRGGGNSKDLERRMRNLQKELRVQKRKLKLALLDMEKTAGFYRKEVERFKTRQTKWINEQQLKIKNRKVIKYVFADDITKIQLRKAGRGGGIKIWTKDGDEAVFTDVDVVLPENYVQKGENADDYDDVLKEVKEDDTLENDEAEDDLKYEESDDEEDSSQELAEPLMQELERRMQDIKSIEQLIFQASLVLFYDVFTFFVLFFGIGNSRMHELKYLIVYMFGFVFVCLCSFCFAQNTWQRRR